MKVNDTKSAVWMLQLTGKYAWHQLTSVNALEEAQPTFIRAPSNDRFN